MYIKFCNRLRELRTTQRYKQKDVAKACNVLPSTYSQWESGKLEPNLEMLVKLADFFEVSLDELFDRNFEVWNNLR